MAVITMSGEFEGQIIIPDEDLIEFEINPTEYLWKHDMISMGDEYDDAEEDFID